MPDVTPAMLANEFVGHATMAHVRVREAQEVWAKEFLDQVRKAAEDIPGADPHLADSFYSDTNDNGVDITTEMGSTDPLDYQYEYGFVGSGADGRTYQRAPHPHWRPTFDAMSEVSLEETIAAAIDWDNPASGAL